ncbi:class I SAM-dependent methyltransferase [Nocardia halotolerans]|uniref:Class I SAM-dependent methyltransferase n=1 Tax=Nocardia halotolerans TaxID=1755878 RepID=A0ABV8VHE7_9NOCA
MPDNTVRAAYTAVHELYTELFGTPAALNPDDTAFVTRYLRHGPVLDLGCGPGHFTKFLTDAGVATTGVDLVPEFITHASTTYPDIPFEVGSIRTLDAPTASIAGLLAWFSLIHIPPPELPAFLTEFHRVLAPGSPLIIGFFTTDSTPEVFPHKVTPAYRWPPDTLSTLLTTTGFTELGRLTRPATETTRPYGALAVARAAE